MPDPTLSRREFVLRAAAAGAGIAVVGGGLTAYRLLDGADAATSAEPRRPTGTVHRFVSRPTLRPPTIAVVRRTNGLAPGLLFLAPSSGPGQRGPLIVDDSGEPVWSIPTNPVTTMNFRAAVYRGKPVLTWWEGKTQKGLGEGTHVILDDSYRVVARIPAGRGRPSDLHEFLLTPHGTALVTAWEARTMSLRSVGGPARGRVIGGVVQELELPSGRVLFEWRSLDHVRLDESHAGVNPAGFDYFHINSVGYTADGNLLVSARNTWAIYKIDRGNGRVLWRLGGKRSDFSLPAQARFAWQHDAREHGKLISLFDNGAGPPNVHTQSRGLLLNVDARRRRATVERVYPHTPKLLAHAMGSLQRFENGNVLIGWGTEPYLTELAADGTVRLDARLPRGGQNYRALRFPWTGTPHVRPAVAVRRSAGAARVYASWNGATRVASWQLLAGATRGSLAAGAKVPRNGFETAIVAPGDAQYAAAAALDADGKQLGTSAVVRLR